MGANSAGLFNSALIISGLLGIIFGTGAFLLFEKILGRVGAVFLILANIALIGVGIYTENAGVLHEITSGIFFVLTALAWVIMGFELRKETKIGYFSILIGVIIAVSIATGLPPLLEHISVVAIGVNGILVAGHLLGKI